MLDRNSDQIIVRKNIDDRFGKITNSMPTLRILKTSRLNILFTKRRHSTNQCLAAFPCGKHYLNAPSTAT